MLPKKEQKVHLLSQYGPIAVYDVCVMHDALLVPQSQSADTMCVRVCVCVCVCGGGGGGGGGDNTKRQWHRHIMLFFSPLLFYSPILGISAYYAVLL